VSFSPVYLRLSRERWRYLIVGARYIVPLGVDKAPPYRRLGVSRITSRYHPRCPTDKEPRVRLWTARHNCAIIAWWKRTAQSAARRWPVGRKVAVGARNCRTSRCRPMRRDACAGTVSVPRWRHRSSPTMEKKR